MKSFANFPHCWLLKKFSHKFMGMRAPRGKLLYDWDMKYTRFGRNEEIFVLMLCLWIPSNIPFFNNGFHMSHNLENKFHCSIFLLFSDFPVFISIPCHLLQLFSNFLSIHFNATLSFKEMSIEQKVIKNIFALSERRTCCYCPIMLKWK